MRAPGVPLGLFVTPASKVLSQASRPQELRVVLEKKRAWAAATTGKHLISILSAISFPCYFMTTGAGASIDGTHATGEASP